MAVAVACEACDWWEEREPSGVPPRCPECGAGVVRGGPGPADADDGSDDGD